jgi:hypothetical protein
VIDAIAVADGWGRRGRPRAARSARPPGGRSRVRAAALSLSAPAVERHTATIDAAPEVHTRAEATAFADRPRPV